MSWPFYRQPWLSLTGNLDCRCTFNWQVGGQRGPAQGEYTFICDKGNIHKFRFVNEVPLNDRYVDFPVNFLEYWMTNKKGKIYVTIQIPPLFFA